VDRLPSGELAIQHLAELKPDLVLMDIILDGDLDGVQAAELITSLHDIPVVFLTAHADGYFVRRARDTGPFGYVLKPFDERELSMVIGIALYRSRVEARLKSLNAQLQEALDQVKTLRGLLPICAWCKKIRDDGGYWRTVETYIKAHADVEFTHGVCPDCRTKVMAGRS
jgi:two-component system, response regulator PdtaR